MLTDKIATVTGAGRGMGEAIARKLVAKGAAVVVSDIDGAAAEKVAADIRAAGGRAFGIRIDVSDEADAARLAQTAEDEFGGLDILVNNAGISTTKLFTETTKADMERILGVNLIGAFLCAQAAVRKMLPRGSGRIINIASLSGQRGGVGRSAYGSSKAGLELLTKVMSVELAAKGILVNNVAPGAIATQMAVEQHDEKTREAYHYLIPQRRYGTPEEVANMVAFLASDEASHVSGTTVNVDGGFLSAGLMFQREGTDTPPPPRV
ncbi:SDR family NAD(P)-dependent oxidoreductase [Acuticoccus kandeliae]|uniref:SDR family NAD(P)-dependent oxidoreductase n=1 Tax=Acuticoccus kandeliae TaxID=2073160 RepID=UPI00196A353A|nr:3-oxoacyl-ACP reductase family protein [Acuticoccus kandeliae]